MKTTFSGHTWDFLFQRGHVEGVAGAAHHTDFGHLSHEV